MKNYRRRIENVFDQIQDDVLDEFNNDNISCIEMENILIWCEKMKKKLVEEYEK